MSCRFRHKFYARYNIIPPTNIKNISPHYDGKEISQIVDSFSTKTYIHDICVKCGKIVKEVKDEKND